jgi:hypothetical protein
MYVRRVVRVRLRELSRSEWLSAGLGQRTDRAVASTLMAAQGDVSRYRRQLRIPAAGRVDYSTLPLGQMPCRVLGELAGTNPRNVEKACRRRGISARSPAKYLTREGLPARSHEEALMDAVLHFFGVPHEHEVAMPGTRFRADFHLTHSGEFLEVAAMLSDRRATRPTIAASVVSAPPPGSPSSGSTAKRSGPSPATMGRSRFDSAPTRPAQDAAPARVGSGEGSAVDATNGSRGREAASSVSAHIAVGAP